MILDIHLPISRHEPLPIKTSRGLQPARIRPERCPSKTSLTHSPPMTVGGSRRFSPANAPSFTLKPEPTP